MPKVVVRYECEHCKEKTYSTKSNCKRHENDCYANPVVKACRTCKYYSKQFETIYNNHHGGNPGSTDYEIEYAWCQAYQKQLGKEMSFKHYCPLYNGANQDNFKMTNQYWYNL